MLLMGIFPRRWAMVMAMVFAFVGVLGGGACAFGDEGDSLAEGRSELVYLLTSLRSDLTARARFSDGGTDRLDQFTANGIAVALASGTFIDIERIEVVITPTTPFSLLTGTLGEEPAGGLQAIQSKHEEGTAAGDGSIIVVLGRDIFVEPLSASDSGGIFGNGRDSLQRYYFETSALTGPIAAGTITGVTVHLRRFQFTGTLNGTAFTSLYNQSADVSTSVSCAANLAAGASVNLNLFMNYSVLFNNLTAATSAAASAAFAANLTNGDLLGEHECFTL